MVPGTLLGFFWAAFRPLNPDLDASLIHYHVSSPKLANFHPRRSGLEQTLTTTNMSAAHSSLKLVRAGTGDVYHDKVILI